MVRGRRARTLVTAFRNASSSPNPKRKTTRCATNNNKSNTITDFFQAVAVEDGKIVLENNGDENLNHSETCNGDIYKSKNGYLPSTPQSKIKNMVIGSEVTSPPTPHRIELRSDSEDSTKKSEEMSVMSKPLRNTSKTRRKHNNNNISENHDDINRVCKESHKLTEYFPVRRSVRKTKTTVLEEKQRILEQALRKNLEEGLEIKYFEGKGRGVIAAKNFSRGEFVVEYSGDLIDINEAKRREELYAQNENTGCYMYYFKYNNQQYCIDATAESGRLGRLVNHSRNGNLITKTILVDKIPRLVLIAKDDIKAGEEVNYDYGDRSKESLKHHPWLAY